MYPEEPFCHAIRLETGLTGLHWQIRPGADFSEVLGPPVIRDSWKNEPPGRKSSSPQVGAFANGRLRRAPSAPALSSNYLASSFATTFAGPDWASTSTIAAGLSRPSSSVRRHASHSALSYPAGRHIPDDPLSDTESVFSDSTTSDSECYGELDYGKEVKRLIVRQQGPLEERGAMRRSAGGHAQGEGDNGIPCSWRRFHGKSSSLRLVTPARKMKKMHMAGVRLLYQTACRVTNCSEQMTDQPESDQPQRKSPERRKEFWTMPSVSVYLNTLPRTLTFLLMDVSFRVSIFMSVAMRPY